MDFRYRARARNGKIVEGSFKAPTQTAALDWVKSQGYFPIQIDEDTRSAAAKETIPLKDRLAQFSTVKGKDLAIFFRQLSTMIQAGVTLASALDILSQQTQNRRLALSIGRVKKLVDSGVTFSRAMKNQREFSSLMVALVQAGEEGGVLDVSLDRLATFLERQDALKKKIVSSLTYPAVVISFAFFALYLLVTLIVPRFAEVFSGLGVPLPKLTLFIFGFSLGIRKSWYWLVGGVLLFVLGVLLLNHNAKTRPFMDQIKLKLPLVGDIIYKSVMARTLRTLATLMEAGVPILSALSMSSEVASNEAIRRAFAKMEEAARKGRSLGETTRNMRVFPLMVAHMISVGEQTGRLEQMLNKVADWFEMELDEKVKRLTSILEPVMILFVGGVVALVAMSIFFPIIGSIKALT